MIEPAHHLVRLFDINGLKLDDHATTMPGVPRIGDEVRFQGECWTVVRVVWEGGRGNWVEVWVSPPEAAE